MGSSMTDEKILSYNDVVLRRSDLDILSGPYFLNDRIIEFYFSYLASRYPSEDMLLVPPSISYWITNCPDIKNLKDFVEPLKLPDKKVVLFTVNDNKDVNQAEGGTHWSLLAYERKANVYMHLDSYMGFNRTHATRLYKAVVGFMGVSNSQPKPFFLQAPTAPQQFNGYDCGLFVMAIAKAICAWHEIGSEDEASLWFSGLNEKVKTSRISQMRSEILNLVRDLMANN